MADSDYICVYRQFFEEFAKSTIAEDHRPMRLNIYNLLLDELVGEVMQSCVNFLTERQCPNSLIVPLTRIVVEELLSEAKKQPEEVNDPLKLNKKTHHKISEVCLRYTDNEKLSSLPPPVAETLFSTHSTKHTRRRMEDRHICLPRFNTLHGVQSNSEAEYYAIFDGHAGVTAASFAVSHLHQFLAESRFYPDDIVQAFREAYEKTESRFNFKDDCGTTSLAILYQPVEKKMTVSWIGDSQALLVTEDSYAMLVDPHKPERQDERKRIENLGGFVMKMHDSFRVNGEIAISRAIGDKKLKPYVSAEPEIRVLNLTGSEHFVVMGCDGLWDVVEPEQVIETVYFELKSNGGRIGTVAKRLVDLAKENNSTDNISVIAFFLTNPSEINNRSIEVTGHRPKIIDQNGSMMEANFQSNDSPLNGIYETSNGNYHHGLHRNSHGYEDQVRNESDEDLGPETDVDALDDVLVLPKGGGGGNNNNPFASVGSDCWQTQKAQFTECSGKLIEFANSLEESVKMGGEREMEKEFQDGFGGTVRVSSDGNVDLPDEEIRENDVLNMKYMNNKESEDGLYDVMSSKYKNEADGVPEDPRVDEDHRWTEQNKEIISNKLSLDDDNSFQGSVINNYSNALNIQNNGSDDNICVSEMGQEETEKSGPTIPADFNPYKPTGNETFEKEGFESDGEEPERRSIEGIESFDAGDNILPEMGFRSPEVAVENFPEFDSDLVTSAPEKMDEDKSETESVDKVEPEIIQHDDLFRGVEDNKVVSGGDDSFAFVDSDIVTTKSVDLVQPEAEDFTSKNYAALAGEKNGSENSPESRPSDVDVSVEEEKKVDSHFAPGAEGNFLVESKEEVKPDLLVPSAPSADELTTITDDIVAESGGEVDSEDDEWNYIKVGSGGDGGGGAPIEEKRQPQEPQQEKEEDRSQQQQGITDFVPSEDSVEEAKVAATMNSPLNPDAAEFIPISPVSATDGDFVMETPLKNVPMDLMADDLVAASPNWSTMRNVALPEESAFLNEIKSRPSNIMEDLQLAHKKQCEAFQQVDNDEVATKNNFDQFSAPKNTENEPGTISPEPRGIALATDMTGSFIDPSTMSSSDEFTKQHNESIIPEIKEPIVEERLMHLTSEEPQTLEAVILEQSNVTSELSELLTPAPVEECISPQSMTGATPKSTVAEVASSPESEASTLPIADVQASPLLDMDVREPNESTTASAPVEIIDLTSSPVETTKVTESPAVEESNEKAVAAAAAGAVAAVVSAAASVAAAAKKDEKKPAPRATPGKAAKPLSTTTTKPSVADAKTGSPTKKPSTVTKTTATARISSATSASTPTKPTASRVSGITKTVPKSPGSTSSTVNKVPAARPKPATTSSTVSRTPHTRTTVTTTTVKSTATAPKPAARATSTTLAAKPKPRVSSAPVEKKTTLNGDIKTTIKKTETSTAAKKPVGTSSLTSTRVSLSARPATAPAKPTATSRTTVTTTTRTLTAKPKTAISSSTTTTTTVTSSGKVSSVTKKTTIGSEKQAKEMANRLTSKTLTSAAPKMNGIGPGKPGATTLKSKRTVTTTTTKTGSTPTKTKSVSKTESKAETIVQKTVEITQGEAETPIIEHTKDINLINSIASD